MAGRGERETDICAYCGETLCRGVAMIGDDWWEDA